MFAQFLTNIEKRLSFLFINIYRYICMRLRHITDGSNIITSCLFFMHNEAISKGRKNSSPSKSIYSLPKKNL